MLAELAAANAAFAVIKKTLSNGREIADCGKSIVAFVNAKDTLQKKGNARKNSFWRQVGGKAGDDLEEFMALEKIRQQEEQLKQLMIYTGRPGLWSDWIKFQGEARVRRQRETAEAMRKRQDVIEYLIIATCITGAIIVVGCIGYMIYISRI